MEENSYIKKKKAEAAKKEKERLSHKMGFRFTEEEYAIAQEMKVETGETNSQLLRRLLLDGEVKIAKFDSQEINEQLRALGGDVNLIARHIHNCTTHKLDPDLLETVITKFEELYKIFVATRNDISKFRKT